MALGIWDSLYRRNIHVGIFANQPIPSGPYTVKSRPVVRPIVSFPFIQYISEKIRDTYFINYRQYISDALLLVSIAVNSALLSVFSFIKTARIPLKPFVFFCPQFIVWSQIKAPGQLGSRFTKFTKGFELSERMLQIDSQFHLRIISSDQ